MLVINYQFNSRRININESPIYQYQLYDYEEYYKIYIYIYLTWRFFIFQVQLY